MSRKYSRANCMGYALGINEWLVPYDKSDGQYMEQYTTKEMVEVLIKHYGLKPVNRKQMVLGKEYIAFRRCYADFHFAKRLKTGQWRQKIGSENIYDMKDSEVFNSGWVTLSGNNYNSKLYLFEEAVDRIYGSFITNTIADPERRDLFYDRTVDNNGYLVLNKVRA